MTFKVGDRVRATDAACVFYLLDPELAHHALLIDGRVGVVTSDFFGECAPDMLRVDWGAEIGCYSYELWELELAE